MIKKVIKKIFKGVSWQHPLFKVVVKIIDPLDYGARTFSGLSHLPPYSDRVVSNGVTKQFGGKGFYAFGKVLLNQLHSGANLTPSSRILEIGCGCGRTAITLSEILTEGHYTGMDIHKGSIDSCLKNKKLKKDTFNFHHLDVQNNEYNAEGLKSAKDFDFPYESESFDIIFMVSVFTHMLTDDVTNYIKEVARMTSPGGTCMVTTFILDPDKEMYRMKFPHKDQEHFYYNQSLPEEAIAYRLEFLEQQFGNYNMTLKNIPSWGSWRGNTQTNSNTGFSQDILFFTKPKIDTQ